MLDINAQTVVVALIASAVVVLIASKHKRAQAVQEVADLQQAYTAAYEGPHIWVNDKAKRTLDLLIPKIASDLSNVGEVRLMTRMHWLSLFKPTVRRRRRRRKPIKMSELAFMVFVFALVGPSILTAIFSQPVLVISLVLIIGLSLLTRWLRWRTRYVVATTRFIATVVVQPSWAFWINSSANPYPVERVEDVRLPRVITVLSKFGIEVGDVHAVTLAQTSDDWPLDLKLVPKPWIIYRIFCSICPKMQLAA